MANSLIKNYGDNVVKTLKKISGSGDKYFLADYLETLEWQNLKFHIDTSVKWQEAFEDILSDENLCIDAFSHFKMGDEDADIFYKGRKHPSQYLQIHINRDKDAYKSFQE